MSLKVGGIKGLAAALKKIEDELLTKLYNRIRNPVREIVKNTITNQLKVHPTYQAISSGQYNAHFGFYPETGESRMLVIVKAIVENLQVELVKIGRLIKMDAFLEYDQIYKLKEAKVYNDSRRAKAGLSEPILDWLEWLLESGGRVTVFDAHINISSIHADSPYSRSKEAIMIRGGNWSVPAAIAGTISDNWITQSIKNGEKNLTNTLRQLITTEFNKL